MIGKVEGKYIDSSMSQLDYEIHYVADLIDDN